MTTVFATYEGLQHSYMLLLMGTNFYCNYKNGMFGLKIQCIESYILVVKFEVYFYMMEITFNYG